MPEEHVLHFKIQPSGAAYSVTLSHDGRPVGEAPFDDAWRIAGETAAALQRIDDGVATLEDLQLVGERLWTGLLAQDLTTGIGAEVSVLRRRQIKEDVHLTIRIEAPSEIHLLPWEALYDPRRKTFLGRDPQCSVLRHPSTDDVDVPDSECRTTGKLRILVVIPGRSGLRVAAEWNALRASFEPHAALLEGGEPKVLQTRVTYDDLCNALAATRYDIVHFIGHGWVDDQDRVWIRMNSADGGEEDKLADVFATAFQRRGVQIVFMNCCHGAVPSTTRAFAGLAPALLTYGVPAVLAMRYAILDVAAARLAGVFYGKLLAGPSRGRVDVAAQEARNSLMGLLDQETAGARLLATPVLFVAPGTTKIFELRETTSPPTLNEPTIQHAPGRSEQARTPTMEKEPIVTTQRALLDRQKILELQAVAISVGLGRTALLSGIDRGLVASLPLSPSPNEQTLSDLTELNALQSLSDGTVPLETWLRNAMTLAGPRREASVFEEAYQRIVQSRRPAPKFEGTRPVTPTVAVAASRPREKDASVAGEPIQIFVSSAPEDEKFVIGLAKHLTPLSRQGTIEIWHSGKLPVGFDQRTWVKERIDTADVVVLMLSTDFLANDDAYGEMERALKLSKEKGTRVVPVRAREVSLESTPVAGLVSLPRSGPPIGSSSNDSAYTQIVTELRVLIDERRRRS